MEKECSAYLERSREDMKSKLTKINFPKDVAAWAVESSNGDWFDALGRAFKKIQNPQFGEAKDGRPPATPCTAFSGPPCTSFETMPPPPAVPTKRLRSKTSIDTPCTLIATQVLQYIAI